MLITLLIHKKVGILAKYLDSANIFFINLGKSAIVLLKQMNINKYIINSKI